jgi:nucleoside recognition membrane protein YjiH
MFVTEGIKHQSAGNFLRASTSTVSPMTHNILIRIVLIGTAESKLIKRKQPG